MLNRHAELTDLLRTLRLPTMADTFWEVSLKATKAGLSHEAFLYELVQLETESRSQRRMERLLRESHLPREKTFRTLALDLFPPLIRQQVAFARSWPADGNHIHGLVDELPVLEPRHLLAALGHTLITQGQPVLWTSTATLMQRLLAAKRDLRLPQELAKLDRYPCLILDDIGYVQHDQDEMEVLFTVLSERYERKSTLISTNLVFSEWTRIFKNPMTTVAAIDRVVHHSVILDLMALESYRVKAATTQRQLESPAESGAAETTAGVDEPARTTGISNDHEVTRLVDV